MVMWFIAIQQFLLTKLLGAPGCCAAGVSVLAYVLYIRDIAIIL